MSKKQLKIFHGKPNILNYPKDKPYSGFFLTDIHDVKSIDLSPVFDYMKDFGPNVVILGGDTAEVYELLKCDSMKFEDFKMDWYRRDIKFISELIVKLFNINKTLDSVIFFMGNHENRYYKFYDKYEENFEQLGIKIDFLKDLVASLPEAIRDKVMTVPYYNYNSHVIIGDAAFIHGDNWGTYFAQKNAMDWAGMVKKAVCGHTHRYQVISVNQALPFETTPYGISAGCLSEKDPTWLQGRSNSWANGFITFVVKNGITHLTPHILEKNRFFVGSKEYSPKDK